MAHDLLAGRARQAKNHMIVLDLNALGQVGVEARGGDGKEEQRETHTTKHAQSSRLGGGVSRLRLRVRSFGDLTPFRQVKKQVCQLDQEPRSGGPRAQIR